MRKILIGTHNEGKFKEIAYLISKKYRKISPKKLNLPSPKETGKTFLSNSLSSISFTIHPADLIKTDPKKNRNK